MMLMVLTSAVHGVVRTCRRLRIEQLFKFHTRDPFYEHGLILMPAWIGNYIHYRVWDEITSPFQISMVQLLKFWNG